MGLSYTSCVTSGNFCWRLCWWLLRVRGLPWGREQRDASVGLSLRGEMWVTVGIDYMWGSCACTELSIFWLHFLCVCACVCARTCKSTHSAYDSLILPLVLSSEDADFSRVNSYQTFPTHPLSDGHKLSKSQGLLKDTEPEIKNDCCSNIPC